MSLSPELRRLVQNAAGKHATEKQPPRGIIPISLPEIDPRDRLIYEVAKMISEAVTGPEVHAHDLAERIVETVEDHYA